MTKADLISQRFKEQHPDLLRLSPDIDIFETLDNLGRPSGDIKINVKHPFVFDNRLVPKKFEGIDVRNIIIGAHPKEFPNGNAALPWFEMFAPEYYSKFVDNNLQRIRAKLKQSNWTREEILDALTEGFKEYVQKCKEGKEAAMTHHREEIIFFNELLEETETAFKKSDIFKNHGAKYKWYYSVMASSIYKRKPMLLGFNWKAVNGVSYERQSEYPIRKFESNYNELGSLKRTFPYFYEYYPEALSGMQSNFCFFRSEKESQIFPADKDLCKPLFLKLIRYSQPSSIVTFSYWLIEYFIESKLIKDYKIQEAVSSGKKVFALKGMSNFGIEPEIPIYYLPNLPAKADAEDRKGLWEFCFREMN